MIMNLIILSMCCAGPTICHIGMLEFASGSSFGEVDGRPEINSRRGRPAGKSSDRIRGW